ncbi:MAG: carboxymuconolactone decarboxylase family protein [Nitrospirae bacterium]|nr:carboxymuconolactone decarboxylase family protein [Nitrospirota bacterium]
MANNRINVKELPKSLQAFIKTHPKVWEAHQMLGVACKDSGPLNDKTLELIKIGISGARENMTSFKTHVRLALRAGVSKDEIEHTILQLLPATGINTMMMELLWAREVIADEKGRG